MTDKELLEWLCLSCEEELNRFTEGQHHHIEVVTCVRREPLVTVTPMPPGETPAEGDLLYMELKINGNVIAQDYHLFGDDDDGYHEIEDRLAHHILTSIFNTGLLRLHNLTMWIKENEGEAGKDYVKQ